MRMLPGRQQPRSTTVLLADVTRLIVALRLRLALEDGALLGRVAGIAGMGGTAAGVHRLRDEDEKREDAGFVRVFLLPLDTVRQLCESHLRRGNHLVRADVRRGL